MFFFFFDFQYENPDMQKVEIHFSGKNRLIHCFRFSYYMYIYILLKTQKVDSFKKFAHIKCEHSLKTFEKLNS